MGSPDTSHYRPDFEAVFPRGSGCYPQGAARAGVEGQVALEATMDEGGKVIDLRILKSDSELLTNAAVQIIQSPSPFGACDPPSSPSIERAEINFRLHALACSPRPSPCIKRVVITFELHAPDHSMYGMLPIGPRVVQAPPDLLIMRPQVAWYPVEAHDLKGHVLVKLTLDEKGDISDVQVSGPEHLQAPALRAAVKMRFAPLSTGAGEVTLDYDFGSLSVGSSIAPGKRP
jgi:TonB family protein